MDLPQIVPKNPKPRQISRNSQWFSPSLWDCPSQVTSPHFFRGRRTATIKADCVCDLRALTRAALLEALSQYPGDKEPKGHSQGVENTSSGAKSGKDGLMCFFLTTSRKCWGRKASCWIVSKHLAVLPKLCQKKSWQRWNQDKRSLWFSKQVLFPSLALPVFGTQGFRFRKPTTIWTFSMLGEFQIYKNHWNHTGGASIFAKLTACSICLSSTGPNSRKRSVKWWRLIVKVVRRQAVLYNVLVPVPWSDILKEPSRKTLILFEENGKWWFLEMKGCIFWSLLRKYIGWF